MFIRQAWLGEQGLGKRVLGAFAVNPSSGRALPYVDGLRAIAVAFIVVLHSWQISGATALIVTVPGLPIAWDFGPMMDSLQLGVPLFFVLSGFLLSQPFIQAHANRQPPPSLRRYFTLRIARIVPAYYFLLFCLLVPLTPFFVAPSLVYSRVGAIAVAAHLLFLQEMVPVASSSFNADPVLWTLTMEALFYISLPWAVRFFYGRRWMVALPVSALISVGWLYICWHGLSALVPAIHAQGTGIPALASHLNITQSYLLLERQLPAHAVDFGLGMTVANWYVRRRTTPAGARRAALCAGGVLAGWALVLWIMVVGSDFRSFWAPPEPGSASALHIATSYYLREGFASLGFAMVLAGVAFGARWLQALFSVLPMRLLGIVSYSIYLWHYIVITMLARWWPAAQLHPQLASASAIQAAALSRFWHLLVGAWVIVIPLAATIYLIVERPFLRLVRSRRSPAPAAATFAPFVGPLPARLVYDLDTAPVPAQVRVTSRPLERSLEEMETMPLPAPEIAPSRPGPQPPHG